MFDSGWFPGARARLLMMATCATLTPITVSRGLGDVSDESLRKLQSAETGGDLDQSSVAAAWMDVSQAGLDDLPALLSAFDGATEVGTNWLSSALDRVLQSAAANGQAPANELLSDFVLDTTNGARGRETALELLREQDLEAAGLVTRQLLDDPVARLRRPAVTALLAEAKTQADAEEQLEKYRLAFEVALDEDHVVASAVALRKLGHPVDHIRKFGFLMHWHIIGPFDYADGKGFNIAYSPESMNLGNIDSDKRMFADTSHPGKDASVRWTAFVNTARNGVVDLNKAVGELRDAVAYAAAVFESERDQEVELRLRQQNSSKMWVNGAIVFSQPIGHTGNFFDQYTIPVKFKKGPNLILIKSCQWPGPVEHPFLKNWQFALRVCDATGNAILAINRPATPELDPLPPKDDAKARAVGRQNEEATDESVSAEVGDGARSGDPADDTDHPYAETS